MQIKYIYGKFHDKTRYYDMHMNGVCTHIEKGVANLLCSAAILNRIIVALSLRLRCTMKLVSHVQFTGQSNVN